MKNPQDYVRMTADELRSHCESALRHAERLVKQRKEEVRAEVRAKVEGILWWARPYTDEEIEELLNSRDWGFDGPEGYYHSWAYADDGLKARAQALLRMASVSSDGHVMVCRESCNRLLTVPPH